MIDSLCQRLQATLGAGFVIQHELGGGGMPRVLFAGRTPEAVAELERSTGSSRPRRRGISS
jgi:hypothetical protein